jgi:hypothetical protein
MTSGTHGRGAPGASLGDQLDSLLNAQWPPEPRTHRLWNAAELPIRLERRIRSLSLDAVWRAYTDGARLWGAIGGAAGVAAWDPSEVALQVFFFGDDGELCSAGIWTWVANGEWRVEKVIDTFSENGNDWDQRKRRSQLTQPSRKNRHG